MDDFSTSTTIDAPPAEVFAAIIDTRGWWNTAIEGPTAHVGDEFGFVVAGLHRTRIRITGMTPDRRVEWLVLENEFAFTTDPGEWVGDRIVFSLQPAADDRTVLTLTQHGLTPGQQCYQVCSNAWSFFVRDSLRPLAERGEGRPESNAGHARPAELARAATAALHARPTPGDA